MTFPDTTFVNNQTVIEADWLNAVNDVCATATTDTAGFHVNRFSGDGININFTLTHHAANEDYLFVYINGVYQQKNTYSYNNATQIVSFSVAPPIGTDNIEIVTASTFALDYSNASLVQYDPAGTGAVPTTVQAKLRETVSVKDFGAVGDGITDDTAAIQAALSTSAQYIIFPQGNYLHDEVTSSVSNRTIEGQGATLIAKTNDQIMLNISGNKTTVTGLNFDGAGKAAKAIYTTGGGCVISSNNIDALYGTATSAVGVFIESSDGCLITNNVIKNVNAVTNGVIGDGVGACRAIQVYSTTDANEFSIIENNIIESITGEEGDAIQIIFFNGSTYPFLNGKTIIQNNSIKNCNRRAVKIQASNVSVIGNTHVNTLSDANLPNALSSISIISSSSAYIKDNVLKIGSKFVGIGCSGSASAYNANCVIEDNTIITTAYNTMLYAEYTTESFVRRNTFLGKGVSVGIQNSLSCVIDDNVFNGGDSIVHSDILIVSNCSKLTVRNNVAIGGIKNYVVENNAPACVVVGNRSMRTDANTGCIRTFATSTGSVYQDNSNASSASSIVGDTTDQRVGNSLNTSTGSNGGLAAYLFFSTDSPAITQPNTHHNRGEIAFTPVPSASGKIGWVCTGSGTPGTWKTFGAIDA